MDLDLVGQGEGLCLMDVVEQGLQRHSSFISAGGTGGWLRWEGRDRWVGGVVTSPQYFNFKIDPMTDLFYATNL